MGQVGSFLVTAQLGRILGTALWLVGALLLAALVLMIVNKMRQASRGRGGDAVHEQLTHFRTLYDQGEISQEEYRRLHTLLAGRIHEKIKPAATEPPKTTPGDATAPVEGDSARNGRDNL